MPRILAVDDNPEIRMLLVLLLQRAGHEVIEAADGTSVMTWVRDTESDVIILDLMMSHMDGWSTLDMLKSDNLSKTIPVIISSAMGNNENLDRARALGAVDYISKPWTADDILKGVLWATTDHR